MWYYGFYRALYGAAKADATIIAFVWPLIATVAIRFITPETAAEIIRLALDEQGIPATVETVDQADLSADLVADDPKFHVHPGLWVANQSLELKEAIAEGRLIVNDEPYKASQGIFILDTDQTRHDVTSLDDLADPATAALFDTDGDGDGEFWLGARGWVSAQNLREWVDSQDLSSVEAEEYSETIFKSKLEELSQAGQPAIFYDYVPDGLHEKYDLRRLGDVPGEQTGDEVEVHVAHGDELTEISPTADRLLRNLSFSTEDMNTFIARSDEGVDPDDIAREWVDSHDELLADWAAPPVG